MGANYLRRASSEPDGAPKSGTSGGVRTVPFGTLAILKQKTVSQREGSGVTRLGSGRMKTVSNAETIEPWENAPCCSMVDVEIVAMGVLGE